MENKKWDEQAKAILKLAEESGIKSNFFFSTTFDRYMTQLSCLDRLKERLKNEDIITYKQYVKGVRNVYPNPVLSEFNKTSDSANKTASTLIRIINTFVKKDECDEIDPLIKILNGSNEE